MRKILIAAMLAISLNAFADWPNYDNSDLNQKLSGKLFIPFKKAEFGVNVAGILSYHGKKITDCHDCDCLINLRWNYGKVDYVINIFEIVNNNSVNVYLDLLDENGFEIRHIFIIGVVPEFTGVLRGSFNMEWNEFSRCKKFDISVRVT